MHGKGIKFVFSFNIELICEFVSVLRTLLPHLFTFKKLLNIPDTLEEILATVIEAGDRGSSVVKVLCYKSEGRWFDPSWCHWHFSLT